MKKILTILLAALLVGSVMTGCFGGSDSSSSSSSESSSSSSESSAPALSGKEQLDKVHSAVKEAYGENYIPSQPFEMKQLSEMYGITSDNIEEFIAEGPMMSTHVDTFIGVKAKEGKAADVEKELTAYKEKIVADSVQYPMNVAKVNASQIVVEGDYVFFVMLGAFYEGTSTDEAEQLKFAQTEVNKAVEAIKAQF